MMVNCMGCGAPMLIPDEIYERAIADAKQYLASKEGVQEGDMEVGPFEGICADCVRKKGKDVVSRLQ